MLKPVGFVPEHDWVCEVYAGWDDDAVRVPEPVRPVGGEGVGWSVDGWGGHLYLPGRDLELPREIAKVKQASDAFHWAIAGLPRPSFLDQRDDPWAYGDRLAWEDVSAYGDTETLAVVDQLRKRLQPVAGPDQVIHGDILPNVLEGPDGQLGVIDWPPYFRPAAMANAIAATDAVTFNHAPLTLLDDWADGADWHQLLVRAVLYRLGPTAVFAAHNRLMGKLVTHLERLRPVLDALLSAS